MTKKDYKLIATAIKRAKDAAIDKNEQDGVHLAKLYIEHLCHLNYKNFNIRKFDEACQ